MYASSHPHASCSRPEAAYSCMMEDGAEDLASKYLCLLKAPFPAPIGRDVKYHTMAVAPTRSLATGYSSGSTHMSLHNSVRRVVVSSRISLSYYCETTSGTGKCMLYGEAISTVASGGHF